MTIIYSATENIIDNYSAYVIYWCLNNLELSI